MVCECSYFSLQHENYIIVSIAYNGVGYTVQTRNRILFLPLQNFDRTTEEGEGSEETLHVVQKEEAASQQFLRKALLLVPKFEKKYVSRI